MIRLAVAVAGALLVRGILFWLRGDYTDWDETMYLLMARNLLEGNGLVLNGLPHAALGPGVPLLTAALSAATGLAPLVSQRLLSVAAGALLLIPVWCLIRRNAGERVAWTATALMVAWPALIDVSPKPGPMWLHMYAGTEPTYLLFLFSAIATGEWALARRGGPAAIAGGAAGALMAAAYVTRAEAVAFAGLYIVLRGVRLVRAPGEDRPRGAATTFAVATVAFFAAASPYLTHLHRATGSWTLSGQPASMGPASETLQEMFRSDANLTAYLRTWHVPEPGHRYMQNPYWGTPEGISREIQEVRFAEVAAAAAPVTRSLGDRALNRLGNWAYAIWTLCGWLFLPFVVVGLWAGRDRELPTFAVAALGASLVVSLTLAALPRFFLYLIPVLALWAARGLLAVADRAPPSLRPQAARGLVGLLVLAAVGIVGARATGEVARAFRRAAVTDRGVAERLAATLPDQATVMHAHPRFAYWGGWRWRIMPYAPLDVVAHYAAERDTRHLLLNQAGYSPLNVEVSHLLITMDEPAFEAMRAIEPGEDGVHAHPPLTLREVAPVAGVAAGVIALSEPAPGG